MTILASQSVHVTFTNVSYHIPPPRSSPLAQLRHCLTRSSSESNTPTTILENISGYVPAGTSLAIMGPSGSGKTSLLNLLAARSQHPPSSGQILFAGRPRVPRTKRHIGYVMQDDVFFSKLTVRETLQFTADIRLPKSMSSEEKKARVDEMLRRLRLEKCQDTRIGDQQFDKGISGGERKRVNIANELLHNPSLLLADECTSGLDSSSAFTVINLLKQLCNEGRTVIATIHQPSSQMFSLFDRILLLAAGRVAYFGTPENVVPYFTSISFPFPKTSYNPADYMLELAVDDRVEDGDEQPSVQARIITAWEQYIAQAGHVATPLLHVHQNAQELILDMEEQSSSSQTSSVNAKEQPEALDPVSPAGQGARIKRALTKRAYDFTGRHSQLTGADKYTNNWIAQVAVLSRRAFKQKSGAIFQKIYIIQVVCITIISALIWFRIEPAEETVEDRLGFLSFSGIFWSFFSTFSALFAFPAEKQVLSKDRAGGSYRLSAYYFAKTTVETPADMVYPLIYTSIVYYAIGLNPYFPSFLLFLIILILTVLAAQSVGLFISAVMMDVRQAQVAASLTLLFSMLVSGYYVNPDNIPDFVRPLRYFSFIKYSYEAFVQNEMMNGRVLQCSSTITSVYSNNGEQCPINADSLLAGAQIEGVLSMATNITILLIWIMVFRTMGYFALKLLHTSHKPSNSSWQ